jgi:hypothetical protein
MVLDMALYFKILTQYFPRDTEENSERNKSGLPVTELIYEPDTYQTACSYCVTATKLLLNLSLMAVMIYIVDFWVMARCSPGPTFQRNTAELLRSVLPHFGVHVPL